MSETVTEWFAIFELEEPKSFPDLKLPSDIILRVNSENKVDKIEIVVVDKWSKVEQIAKERIKKFETILSIKLNFNFNYKFAGWARKEGNTRLERRIVTTTLVFSNANRGKNPKLDIEQLLNSGDSQYWRQTGHFAKGKKATDPVERYREFFLIVEDEGNPLTDDEKALRHAVNHPFVSYPGTVRRVRSILGSPFFNPMKDEHIKIVQEYANRMQEKAQTIINNK